MSGTSRIPGAASPLPTIGGGACRPLPGRPVPHLDREFKEYTVARLENLANNKADLASPAFTGTPTAPTPSSGDSSTKIATTAFVAGEMSGKYTMPSDGIPMADLAQDVQASLGRADTALQPGNIFSSGTTIVDSSHLPSYVDDVLGYDTKAVADLAQFSGTANYAAGDEVKYGDPAKGYRFTEAHAAGPWTGEDAVELTAFPATGETGKIYVALDTNRCYRWESNGNAYVMVGGGTLPVPVAPADATEAGQYADALATKNELQGKFPSSGGVITGTINMLNGGVIAVYTSTGIRFLKEGGTYDLFFPQASGTIALLADTMRFSSTVAYAVEDICFYSGAFYRCTTAHTGEWNGSHFTKIFDVATDVVPTADSTKLLTSGAISTALGGKLGNSGNQMLNGTLEIHGGGNGTPTRIEAGQIVLDNDSINRAVIVIPYKGATTDTLALLSDMYAAVQQIAPEWSKPSSGQTGTTYTKGKSLCTYNGVLYLCANTYTTDSSSEAPPSDIYDSGHTDNHWVVEKVSEFFLPRTGGEMVGGLTVPNLTVGSRNGSIGVSSVTEGNGNVASGNYSHAEGARVTAQNDAEHAQGSYNASHTGNTDGEKTLSSIGFGKHLTNRKNAVETMQDGKTYIYGVGGYDGTNPTASGVKDLAAAVNEKANRTDIEPLLFEQYYPDGSVKSAAEFTQGIKYNTPDTVSRTITVKPFCNTGSVSDDNCLLSGRVVIPPFVDADGNGYIFDDGTRFKVVGVGNGAVHGVQSVLTAIVVPNTVTNIESSAFYGCTSLKSLSLPSVTDIGNSAFNGCTSLKSLSLPSATDIGGSAFYGCTSLTSVSLPAATDIWASAFYGCTSLTSVSLPAATGIRAWAFNGCTSLASVDFSAALSSVPSLGVAVFDDVPNTCKIIVPGSLYDEWTAETIPDPEHEGETISNPWYALVQAGYQFLRHSEWEYARKYELDGKAPLASPAFTGTPTAPTPTSGDNSTKVATTAFVQNAMSGITPGPDSTKANSTAIAPAWSNAAVSYAVGQTITYNGNVYECMAAYTTDAQSLTPDQDIYDDSTTPATGHWKVTDMTTPDATLDVTSAGSLRVVAADGTILWQQGYKLKTESSSTLDNEAGNRYGFAANATANVSLVLPTAPTGKVGDFIFAVTNPALDTTSFTQSAFSDAATYAIGDEVIYDSKIWRCVTAVSTAGAWTGTTNWEEAWPYFSITGLSSTVEMVVPKGQNLSDILTFAPGAMCELYFTLTSFALNGKPTWKVVRQNVEVAV